MKQPPSVPDYSANLKTDALAGARVGVLNLTDILGSEDHPNVGLNIFAGSSASQTQASAQVSDKLTWAASIITDLGAIVKDNIDLTEDDQEVWRKFATSNSTTTVRRVPLRKRFSN